MRHRAPARTAWWRRGSPEESLSSSYSIEEMGQVFRCQTAFLGATSTSDWRFAMLLLRQPDKICVHRCLAASMRALGAISASPQVEIEDCVAWLRGAIPVSPGDIAGQDTLVPVVSMHMPLLANAPRSQGSLEAYVRAISILWGILACTCLVRTEPGYVCAHSS